MTFFPNLSVTARLAFIVGILVIPLSSITFWLVGQSFNGTLRFVGNEEHGLGVLTPLTALHDDLVRFQFAMARGGQGEASAAVGARVDHDFEALATAEVAGGPVLKLDPESLATRDHPALRHRPPARAGRRHRPAPPPRAHEAERPEPHRGRHAGRPARQRGPQS